MVRKKKKPPGEKPEPRKQPEPILVHCIFRLPKKEADAVLPLLPIAFDCGGAAMRRTRTYIEVQADLEIRTVGAIVERGIPVLVTERLPVEPIPADQLIDDAAAWFRQIERER